MDPHRIDAGAQMDRLIAALIFGDLLNEGTLTYDLEAARWISALATPYSTNIAAAWSVIDYLGAKGFILVGPETDPCASVSGGVSSDERTVGWCARFQMNQGEVEDWYFGDGETAALAICRAALAYGNRAERAA